MNYAPIAILSTLALLIFILLAMELGRRTGLRRLVVHGEAAIGRVAAVDGAVFGLLGLLLAFTFSGAASRFDSRRELIVQESNDIGTAYLRLDLLPAGSQPALRDKFRSYVDSRINVYRALPDLAAARVELGNSARLQTEIWTQAVAAARMADTPAANTLLLPAINDMIDITTTRTAAAESHPPAVVFVMLMILILASSFLAGHSMATTTFRWLLHMICFAVVMSTAVYVILDFEFPRFGLIRVNSFDHLLADVRESMK